jgi:hypothetical protein
MRAPFQLRHRWTLLEMRLLTVVCLKGLLPYRCGFRLGMATVLYSSNRNCDTQWHMTRYRYAHSPNCSSAGHLRCICRKFTKSVLLTRRTPHELKPLLHLLTVSAPLRASAQRCPNVNFIISLPQAWLKAEVNIGSCNKQLLWGCQHNQSMLSASANPEILHCFESRDHPGEAKHVQMVDWRKNAEARG